MVAAPKDADRNPETVTPICTAERKLLGFWVSFSTVRPRCPLPASCLTWLSRSVTSAISAAAKVPPIRMNRKISAMSDHTVVVDTP